MRFECNKIFENTVSKETFYSVFKLLHIFQNSKAKFKKKDI